MTIDLVIRNGKAVTPHGIVEGDIAIEGERIVSVGTPVTTAKQVIDAQGHWVMPGA